MALNAVLDEDDSDATNPYPENSSLPNSGEDGHSDEDHPSSNEDDDCSSDEDVGRVDRPKEEIDVGSKRRREEEDASSAIATLQRGLECPICLVRPSLSGLLFFDVLFFLLIHFRLLARRKFTTERYSSAATDIPCARVA